MKNTRDELTQLQNALKLIQQNQFSQAIAQLEPFNSSTNSDTHYLLGVAYKGLERFSEAISHLEQAIQLSPNKAELYNHLAKCYWANNDLNNAEQTYLAGLKCAPQNHELQKNICLFYLEQQQYDSAKHWAGVGSKDDSSGQFVKLLGDIAKAQNQLSEAIQQYQKVPQSSPVLYRAVHSLGLCYKTQSKFEQAIQCFLFVHQNAPNQYEPLYNLADCYFANSQFDLATQAYQHALARAPYNVTIHKSLNELYWQNGQHELFATSIHNALKTAENQLQLANCLVELYWNTGQYEACKTYIAQSKFADSAAQFLTVRGRLAALDDDFAGAFSYLQRANDIEFDLDRVCEQAKFAIQLNRFEQAHQLLDKVLAIDPNSQLALAWLSVIYQATNDERHQQLCNPDFVLTTELAAPPGYPNAEAFISELEACLLELHKGKQAPSEQTLVNGSQISGGLLNRDIAVITQARQQLLIDIEKRLQQLTEVADHPFLAHLSAPKQIMGSWSVKLTEQGFHVSHIHPDGWISVVLYINTPQDDSDSGVIEFGRPPLSPPHDYPPFKQVKPKRGQIVIFPSYFWHGTQPFDAQHNSYRMTLPMDIGVTSSK